MNLLITGALQNAEQYIKDFSEQGHSVLFCKNENEKLPCEYSWVEGAICNGLFQHHSIDKFTSLKFLQLTSAGFDRVPMDYINKSKISIYNAKGVYSIPMAEDVVLKTLELFRKSSLFFRQQREHIWKKNRDLMEIFGKRAVVLGCGAVGLEIAKRLKSFGMVVVGVDILDVDNDCIDTFCHYDNMDDVLKTADVVIITLPLTEQTYKMFNRKRFAVLKKTAMLINVSRGKIIDQDALLSALKNNELQGIAFDVFDEEPLSEESCLWDMDNVIITPHNSFVGDGNYVRMYELIMNNFKRWNEML